MADERTISGGRLPESNDVKPIGAASSDSTIPQTFSDVKGKAESVRLNKDGTPRKKYTRTGSGGVGEFRPEGGAALPTGGFNEDQVKATFKGLHSMAALSTNCNVWFLTDDEAKCFVPSATLALNQIFPGLATSKWGALSLASLSYAAVLISKTLTYAQFKRAQAQEPEIVPPGSGGN